MTDYRQKILNILKGMSALTVRHANQPMVHAYLEAVETPVEEMTSSFQASTERLSLLPRFQTYIQQEESRVRKHLDTARYDLDAPDTLVYINGRRGLERVSARNIRHPQAVDPLLTHTPESVHSPLSSFASTLPGHEDGSGVSPPPRRAPGCRVVHLHGQGCLRPSPPVVKL